MALAALTGATVVAFPAVSDAASSTGQISIDDLTANPIDLPEWGTPALGDTDPLPPCPTTGATIHAQYAGMQEIDIEALEQGDVDRDGTMEAIGILECPVYQAARVQVVAFKRTGSGSIVVLGQVVRQGVGPGTIKHLEELTITETGRIGVIVSDRQPCCGSSDELAEHQQRWYTWMGSHFLQIGGPTSFHPIPSEYGKPTVAVAPLRLGPAVDGTRRGSTIVRISNPGPASTPGIRFEILARGTNYEELPAEVMVAVRADCTRGTTMSGQVGLVCHFPAFPASVTRNLRIGIVSPVALDSLVSGGTIEVHASAEQRGIRVLPGGSESSWATSQITIAS